MTPATIERTIHEAMSSSGIRRTLFTADWRGFVQGRGAGNTPFTALANAGAGVVGVGSIELGTVDDFGILYNATADATDEAMLSFVLPPDFDPERDEIAAYVLVRKHDTTGSATENADLRLDGIWEHFGPGDATYIQETAIQNLLPAKTALHTFANFTVLKYQAKNEGLRAGGRCNLRLYCHEAVGTALSVHILGATVVIGAQVGIVDRDERFRLWTTGNGS